MKKISMTNIVLFVLLVIAICYAHYNKIDKPKSVSLKTYADSLSYSLGYIYGLDIAEVPFDFNMRLLFRGLVNASDPSLQVMSDEEIIGVLERFSDVMANQHLRDHTEQFNKNVEEGLLFMENNAHKADVITTESGLQYRVIHAGNGRRPNENSTVVAHYTGKFIDGEIFDSSHFHGEAMTFDLGMVIEGWTEAILLMREGDKFEIVLPYDLAYGERGFEIIEPGATLIFEIELIQVVR